ncbi:MAG: Chromosome partition protein Smc [Alphaproteobacteria bacterium MarineAlpha5_Bin11]|nr:MAG: Chromosome partition protein Smc [Alphaproteobacteria bacterium MarineAlpha5_Bin11]PPR51986.1 MAG: Chromosome partition protein Smc [Alphaproteobacteria bacterium MarineAlpha5_Bin10]|tara:strand:+ start:1747 stop:3165 length:1419 start_codon:yes stop_codon:yes gene_type:complete
MVSNTIKRRISESPNIWPGFVDILATLLIVIIFILMVFTVSQFYLSDAVVGRDKALAELKFELRELSKILSTTEKDLQAESEKNIQLFTELQKSENIIEERDKAVINLSGQINKLREELQIVANALMQYEGENIDSIDTANLGERINRALAGRVEQLKNLNMELTNLNNQLIALNEELDIKDVELLKRLEEIKANNLRLSELNETLVEKDRTIVSLRGKISKLNDILVISEEEKAKQELTIKTLSEQVEESKLTISKSEETSKTALEEISLLSAEIEKINQEFEILNAALEASEKDRLTKELKIEVLGERLNKALTSKVVELQEYRSEFFGRLKEILGEREDIRIVGDRFIFESELLFDSGSASLQEEGKNRMLELATKLKTMTDEIPPDINWIVQVEGHTDNRPISTYQYPSNWELSTARANSVLKLLLEAGFGSNRLAAAGYGESFPISDGNTEADLRQNRRIELKLTSR